MSHMKIVSRTLLVLVLASTLTACGFHLRGNIPLPDAIKSMYVEAQQGPFKEMMEEALISGGASIASSPEGATSTLIITQSAVEKTVGTLDERGKANSYELIYRVRYNLVDTAGTSLRRSSINERRRYDFDPDIVLETESEEEELIVDMEETITLRIMRQLATVTVNNTPTATN